MKFIFPLEVLFLLRGVGASSGRISTSDIIIIAGSVCLITACPVKPDAGAANHSNICRGSTPRLRAQLHIYIDFPFRKPKQPDLVPPSSIFSFTNCSLFSVFSFIYFFAMRRGSGSNRRTVSKFEFDFCGGGQNNKVIKGDQHIVRKTLPVTGPPTLPQSDRPTLTEINSMGGRVGTCIFCW